MPHLPLRTRQDFIFIKQSLIKFVAGGRLELPANKVHSLACLPITPPRDILWNNRRSHSLRLTIFTHTQLIYYCY